MDNKFELTIQNGGGQVRFPMLENRFAFINLSKLMKFCVHYKLACITNYIIMRL